MLRTLILLIYQMTIGLSCSRIDPDIEISKSVRLSSMPDIIQCTPTLKMTRESNAVHFIFPGEWTLNGEIINFQDGRAIAVSAVLVDQNGKRYVPNGYGQAIGNGVHAFVAYFSKLDQSVIIANLEVSASEDVLCDKVFWHCYDPI